MSVATIRVHFVDPDMPPAAGLASMGSKPASRQRSSCILLQQ